MIYELELALSRSIIEKLAVGDVCYLSGTIYTARDAAHKRIVELLESGGKLPFELKDSCIYYAGPCPAAPGEVIGPCGPTTSGRMDAYAPKLIEMGVNAMIGKGQRSTEVLRAMRGRAVYFAATGGAAALISDCVVSAEVIGFEELGAEAVRRLVVKRLPVVVAADAFEHDIYAH